MGCCWGDIGADLDSYQPNFFVQKGEQVIYTLKCTKRSIHPLVAAILTLITLGLFLFFKDACKRVRSVQIIVLTNKRVMEWEYKLPRKGRDMFTTYQHSYNIVDMVYYQHEIVQDAATCFGLCKTKPYSTMRVFFNKYPIITPPSYNNSPSLRPCLSDVASVANLTKNVVTHGIAHNYIGAAINGIKLLAKILQLLAKVFSSGRSEIDLPGHYIELDTNDKGSAPNIITFLQHLNNLYPRKAILRGPIREGSVVLQNDDLPLFEHRDDPVRLNPNYLQLGREEVVFDANVHKAKITLWDWFLAVITFSLYYWLVIRDLKNYKGGLLVSDRRFITIFTHNHKGFQPGEKYVQLVNCYFFTKMNSAAVQTQRPSSCLTSCCEPTWRTLLVDCGPGTLSVTPNPENGEERIHSLFSKFFSYRSCPLLTAMPVDFQETNEVGLPDAFRVEGERLLYDIGSQTEHDCSFGCSRVLSCGFVPPHITHDIGISSHRLYVKYTVSNFHFKNFLQLDFFTRLENVRGMELSDFKINTCCCCGNKSAFVGICFRNDPGWTLSMQLCNMDLHSEVIQRAGQAISYMQCVLQDIEETQIVNSQNANLGGYAAPTPSAPGPSRITVVVEQ